MNKKTSKIKAWINALRLRTLPLSVSGVLLGSFIALQTGEFSINIAFWCLLTIILLQILSNLANDLGDSIKGTDNKKRVGPMRSVQSGTISKKEMKMGIGLVVFLSLLSGVTLLFQSLQNINYLFLILFIIGILGIIAALKYTLGKGAYGYYGLGDLFVMIFFGFIPVAIAFYLQTKEWNNILLLAGLSIGSFSTSVLNLNNLRDYKNDKDCNKKTLIVKMGLKYGKLYHFILIAVGIGSALLYTALSFGCLFNYIYIITFIPFIQNIIIVARNKNTILLDKELKRNAIGTFLLTLHWGIGLLLC